MEALDGRRQIAFEFQGFTKPGQQKALRFLLNKMGPQPEEDSVWDNFARTEKKYPAMTRMFKYGKTYPLQGDFNDARESLAQEYGEERRYDQSALQAILTKIGPQTDEEQAWQEFQNGEKKNPQLYYKLFYKGDISWHDFADRYSARIERGESISDIMKEHRQSRMKLGNREETSQGMYATARIEAALRMTKGDTKKAASLLASMGKKD